MDITRRVKVFRPERLRLLHSGTSRQTSPGSDVASLFHRSQILTS